MIQNTDPDESPFTLFLTGRQATATNLWQQTHFGSMGETGPAAEQSDPEVDGIPYLVGFAFGSHAKQPTPAPGTLVRNGSTLPFTCWRSKAALGETAFVREFSQSPADSGFHLRKLALALQELQLIYRVQFPVTQQHDQDAARAQFEGS